MCILRDGVCSWPLAGTVAPTHRTGATRACEPTPTPSMYRLTRVEPPPLARLHGNWDYHWPPEDTAITGWCGCRKKWRVFVTWMEYTARKQGPSCALSRVVHHYWKQYGRPSCVVALSGSACAELWRNNVTSLPSCCIDFWFHLLLLPVRVAGRSKAWTVFVRSNTGIVGSNPTWDMDVCVRLLCVCVFCV
jgi:hypothetical protein